MVFDRFTRGRQQANRQLDIAPNEELQATTLELFFDLVFVFAFTRLSLHAVETGTWMGGLETLVLCLAVFQIWAYTTYESTMVLARSAAARWVVLVTMGAGLVMNASIGEAFGEHPWVFVGCLVGIQVFRSLATRMYDVDEQLRRHRIAMVIWALGSAVFWCVGAAAEEHRIWWWLLALIIDLVGARSHHYLPGRGHRLVEINVGFDAAHQIERCRLFFIICLGEGVLTTGTSMSHHLHSYTTLVTGLLSFVVLVTLWFVFLATGAEWLDEYLEKETGNLRIGEIATNGQLVLVGGLLSFAIGAEVAVGEPHEPLGAFFGTLLVGGPALCLIAMWIFMNVVTGQRVASAGLLGSAALVLAGGAAVAAHLPAVGVLAVVAVVCCATAAWFHAELRKRPVHAVRAAS